MSNSHRASHRPPSPKVQLICDCGCNQTFFRYRNKISPGLNFVSQAHSGAYRSAKDLRDKTGPHEPLVREFLEGPAQRLWTVGDSRNRLLPFFAFLCNTEAASITDVTSATITAFKDWAPNNGYRSAGADPSAIRTFFEWARYVGYYDQENPVDPKVHGKVNKKGTGRPYTVEEIRHMRDILVERGNKRLRAFFELALASGLRKEELCRLRLTDVTLDDKELIVRLPNKTGTERKAFFDDLVYEYLKTWLAVRRSDCTHDFLFHSGLGRPLKHSVIKEEFNRVLCAPSPLHPDPSGLLTRFDLHRLRHTAASNLASVGAEANTIANQFGWADPGSRDGYVRIDEHKKIEGFVAAMEIVNDGRAVSSTTNLSADDFLAAIIG